MIKCLGELVFIYSTAGIHAAVQNCGIQIRWDHNTDADISVVVANILNIGHLMIGTPWDELYVFTLIRFRILFNLLIGVEGIASLVFACVAAAFLLNVRPQFRRRCLTIGYADVLTMQAGFQQFNLHISHSKRIGGVLGISEVRHGCTNDGDCHKGDAQEDCG